VKGGEGEGEMMGRGGLVEGGERRWEGCGLRR